MPTQVKESLGHVLWRMWLTMGQRHIMPASLHARPLPTYLHNRVHALIATQTLEQAQLAVTEAPLGLGAAIQFV